MNTGPHDQQQSPIQRPEHGPNHSWPDEKRYFLTVNVIIENSEGKILLLKRSRKSIANPDRWDLPGGKVDACESFQDAIHREVREEIGRDVRITHLVGSSEYRVNGTDVVFLIMHGEIDSEEISLSDEHEEYLWITPSLIPEMDLCDHFSSVLKKYVNQ